MTRVHCLILEHGWDEDEGGEEGRAGARGLGRLGLEEHGAKEASVLG